MTTKEFLIKEVNKEIKLHGNPYDNFRADKFGIRDWKVTKQEINYKQELVTIEESIKILTKEKERIFKILLKAK